MSCFEIMISDEQKDMIVAALAAYKYPACFEPADREELDILHDMFAGLKDDDSNHRTDADGVHRHVMHGFCL